MLVTVTWSHYGLLVICQRVCYTMPQKSLFSSITTQFLNNRLSVGSSPALSSRGMSQKKKNPVFLLTLLKLSTLLFSLNRTIVRHCIVVSTVEAIHSCKWFQNAAASLLTGKQNRDHISAVLAKKWLAVCFYGALRRVTAQYISQSLL